MILDIYLISILVPLVAIIGLIIMFYGKETLGALSFPIGAVAGGFLAYMIFRGILAPYEIPLFIEVFISVGIIFGCGFLGKGILSMLLSMFAAVVLMDVFTPILKPLIVDNWTSDYQTVMAVFGILVFFVLVIFVQRYTFVFASFMGGVLVTLTVTPLFGALDEPYLRIVQLVIAVVLTVIGAIGMTGSFIVLGFLPANYWSVAAMLLIAGLFAGFYIVPL
ncbi:MAG: hypothetical protein ACMUIG_09425, partial [Thermoplasmatota archaeon]